MFLFALLSFGPGRPDAVSRDPSFQVVVGRGPAWEILRHWLELELRVGPVRHRRLSGDQPTEIDKHAELLEPPPDLDDEQHRKTGTFEARLEKMAHHAATQVRRLFKMRLAYLAKSHDRPETLSEVFNKLLVSYVVSGHRSKVMLANTSFQGGRLCRRNVCGGVSGFGGETG